LVIEPTGPVTEPTTDAIGLVIGSLTWAIGSGVAFAGGVAGVMPAPSGTWTGGFGWRTCGSDVGFGLTDTGGLGTVAVGLTDRIEGFGWWTCGTTVGLGLTDGAAGFGVCTAGGVVAGGLLEGRLTGGAGGFGAVTCAVAAWAARAAEFAAVVTVAVDGLANFLTAGATTLVDGTAAEALATDSANRAASATATPTRGRRIEGWLIECRKLAVPDPACSREERTRMGKIGSCAKIAPG
jgi:hypothetical protein